MKFLACTHCLSEEASQLQQPVQEITNPLVVTKRPASSAAASTVTAVHPHESSPSSRKKRLPGLLSALTSWPRRRQANGAQKHSSHPRSVRRVVRVIEQPQRRRVARRPPTRTQRLIRLYEERAASPDAKHPPPEEYLIDPPASFSGDDSLESHQNFKNKLNTLDFERMNTVALEEPSPSPSRCESDGYGKNSFKEKDCKAVPIGKFARKTLLEDFFKERVRIEQTMIDLLNGRDPGSMILKKSRNDDRKVRFREAIADKGLRVDVTGDKRIEMKEDGSAEQQTEIKLRVDPMTKVDDLYIERKTVFLKDKTIEDKALVLKISPKDQTEGRRDVENTIGMRRPREMVFHNFGKMHL